MRHLFPALIASSVRLAPYERGEAWALTWLLEARSGDTWPGHGPCSRAATATGAGREQWTGRQGEQRERQEDLSAERRTPPLNQEGVFCLTSNERKAIRKITRDVVDPSHGVPEGSSELCFAGLPCDVATDAAGYDAPSTMIRKGTTVSRRAEQPGHQIPSESVRSSVLTSSRTRCSAARRSSGFIRSCAAMFRTASRASSTCALS